MFLGGARCGGPVGAVVVGCEALVAELPGWGIRLYSTGPCFCCFAAYIATSAFLSSSSAEHRPRDTRQYRHWPLPYASRRRSRMLRRCAERFVRRRPRRSLPPWLRALGRETHLRCDGRWCRHSERRTAVADQPSEGLGRRHRARAYRSQCALISGGVIKEVMVLPPYAQRSRRCIMPLLLRIFQIPFAMARLTRRGDWVHAVVCHCDHRYRFGLRLLNRCVVTALIWHAYNRSHRYGFGAPPCCPVPGPPYHFPDQARRRRWG